MEEITITFQTILAFFGAVAVIGGGLKLIIEATMPFKRMAKRQDEMDMKLDNDNKRFKEIEKEYKELKDMLNANSKLLLQLTEHILHGNNKGELEKKQSELLAKLLEK